ncbi:50S ribosomal protein L25/general stress protein Ctc [Paenibacillus sp. GCM10027626]|uniref:50S ribosomal protein L25/general stress protein Ctc n=1 Tax=Paenibacillus sp. GCM10027626 TaxID=3273411 RepID=UPI00364410BE
MTLLLKADARKAGSRGALNQLRQKGQIPGVVYGKKIGQPLPVSVSEKELLNIIRTHPNAVLELQLAGGKQPAMLAEIQRDPLSGSVLHIDFHQIDMNEEVKAAVRIEWTGEAQGVKEGGILQAMLHEIEVQCLPDRLPEAIEIDISQLQVGENLLVSSLELPAGVKAKMDPDQVVVTILAPQKDTGTDIEERLMEEKEMPAAAE